MNKWSKFAKESKRFVQFKVFTTYEKYKSHLFFQGFHFYEEPVSNNGFGKGKVNSRETGEKNNYLQFSF